MSTVFLTGATGFIGQQVAFAFQSAGFHVIGLVRNLEKAKELVRAQVEVVVGDMRQPESWLKQAALADVLVHCGCDYSALAEADKVVLDALLSVAKSSQSRKTLVYTSGAWLYGELPDHVQATEHTQANSIPKLVGWRVAHERAVLDATYVDGIVVRPSCVYGRQGSLTASWIGGALSKTEVTLPSRIQGKQYWSFVHVDDLARGYLAAAQHGRAGRIYNLVAESARVDDVISAFFVAAGEQAGNKKVKYVQPSNPFEECLANSLRMSSAAARQDLHWVPFHASIVESAPQVVAAFKAYQ